MATLRSNRLGARAARSSLWLGLSYSASQALRLGSNLVLARLLIPEAFGLMALVTVFIVGLTLFSDLGLRPAISQSARGDDPVFLNTGWTLQVIRGLGLWLTCCALAVPAAWFYDVPLLAQILPVAGLSLLIAGFNPTRILTANRHLALGRMAALDLAGQALGIGVMIALAAAMQSVWALVLGGVIGALAHLGLTWAFLPGPRNRFLWDWQAARELVNFGKWIFLSSVCGFFLSQGDKAILGKVLSLDLLGIYNIAFFLASFPTMLGLFVIGRVMIPLYRESPPWEGPSQFARLRNIRMVVTGGILALLMGLAFAGGSLVSLLYEPRYQAAAAIVVLIACIQMFALIGMTYDQVALAAGQPRAFFLLTAARAVLVMAGLVLGAYGWGLIGALAGKACAVVLSHPLIAWLAARHRAWDPLHDIGYAVIAGLASALALQTHWPAIMDLAEIAR